ncbi:LysM peptidoglycan-binding domain-containing protein [Agromyces intestinalis]|uniref:LysM peptidoglycan-binding domain-containing protein n=1 Tax=Agromyces intestinalis TaxID=2592652 RepID=A0A5C1YB26_9MICO|nr:LysM peptidoglycan-binding domain-containing protein [Agromyces intestinalis]QEO13201.1 LysM peptidoglycan-binding domain-containing protein [Agromyces intestinalis]
MEGRRHPRRRGTVGSGEASEAEPRRLRRILATPIAVLGAVAVTLGIAPPADAAAPPAPKRQPKPKAESHRPHSSPHATVAGSAPAEYVVVAGDTVSGIAERFGLATAEVLALNGLGWSTLIFPGQRLLLRAGGEPHEPPPTTAPDLTRHTVVEGDTVIGIADAHGLDVGAVLSANGLDRTSLIFPGEQLVLPLGATASAPAPEPVSEPAPAPEPTPAPGPAEPVEPVASVSMPLNDETRQNAVTIIEIGRSLGVPDRGIVIALAAAAQESGLKNSPTGDADSLGLFQQRPSQGWGTPEEVMDPVRATTAFYGGDANPNPGRTRGLLDVPGWESMTLTQAAQAVQISAHPERYAKWEEQASAWLAELG